MEVNKKYDANFTAGGLMLNEFLSLKEILESPNFEILIEEEKEQNKYIGVDTNSARKRIITEIKRRNNKSPNDFWEYFFAWNPAEQKLALLYLVFKSYPIIMDLHLEVALKKFKTGSELNAYDIQMRFDELASKNENVAAWRPSTLKKLNVQYRKTLKDSGLYDGNILSKPSGINSNFWSYFLKQNDLWFKDACFS